MPSPTPLPAPFDLDARAVAEAGFLVSRALAEDAPDGDITSDALFGTLLAGDPHGRFALVSREVGVLCGVPVARRILEAVDPRLRLEVKREDGTRIEPGEPLLVLDGPVRSVLRAERVVLNFVQRLSGIATVTREFVDLVAGTPAAVYDTRKTTPAWRHLEKYAVRAGGGRNHRPDLSSAFLLKDNHVAVLRAAGRNDREEWVDAMRRHRPAAFLEVEVDSRDEFLAVLPLDVDAILLDNFGLDSLRWAVAVRSARGDRRPALEASGGVRRETLRSIAETGVDRISVGAITHSVRSLDMGLDALD